MSKKWVSIMSNIENVCETIEVKSEQPKQRKYISKDTFESCIAGIICLIFAAIGILGKILHVAFFEAFFYYGVLFLVTVVGLVVVLAFIFGYVFHEDAENWF